MEYLNTLNDKQKEAVLHSGAPLLILAGAGSGKTRVITTKIAYLIEEKGINPSSILAVTFTNKAAKEMHERVEGLTGGRKEVLIKTFHSFCSWLLRRNAPLAGLHHHFKIYDDDDTMSLLKTLYENIAVQELKRHANWISRAKDNCYGPDDESLFEISADPDFPDIYGAYEERLRDIGNVDFGDLIMRAVELLEKNEEVRMRVRQRFQMILVDEYQDSNGAQFRLLKALVGPHTQLCVVGDDDQSIYRFRGAEVKHILEFEEAFPGTEVIRLEENYRSTQNILSIASTVVANNKGRLGKKLWTRNGEGESSVIAYLPDQNQEAEFCASLLEDGRLEETAILYRTNAQSRAFESIFIKYGIPYKIVGTLRFYEREEIKDVIAWLALLTNPNDEVAFRRIINKPARGIGKVGLSKILNAGSEPDLLSRLKKSTASISGKALGGVKEFLHMYEEMSMLTAAGGDLADFISNLVHHTRLYEYYESVDSASGTFKIKNIEEMLNAAAEYSCDLEGITTFLESVELDSQGSEEEDTTNKVTLITMHNTKGLEFDRVIITGLEEDLFPGGGRELTEEDVEEERRLFYVAITRARKELYFTCCSQRLHFGKIKYSQPSRFMYEIPKDFVSTEGSAGEEDSDGFKVGDTVYHDEHGVGAVIKVWDKGGEDVVFVRFETNHVKQFIPAYTPLEKITIDY